MFKLYLYECNKADLLMFEDMLSSKIQINVSLWYIKVNEYIYCGIIF